MTVPRSTISTLSSSVYSNFTCQGKISIKMSVKTIDTKPHTCSLTLIWLRLKHKELHSTRKLPCHRFVPCAHFTAHARPLASDWT